MSAKSDGELIDVFICNYGGPDFALSFESEEQLSRITALAIDHEACPFHVWSQLDEECLFRGIDYRTFMTDRTGQ